MAKDHAIVRTVKNGTIIAKCSCRHDFQDRTYGNGNRVMNLTSNGKGRCTVCSKVQSDK